MLKKHLLLTIVTLLCCSVAWGQSVVPETGKAYRVINPFRDNKCMAATYNDGIIAVVEKNTAAYEQMWILEKASDKSVYIKNGYTGKYIQHASKMSELFTMADTPKEFFVTENKYNKNYYNLLTTENGSRGLHASPSSDVVVWTPSTTSGNVDATEWVFEDAGVSIEVLAQQQEIYRQKSEIIDNADKYNGIVTAMFTDRSCSELKAEYANMSDAELLEAAKELPGDIANMMLKVKNGTWGKREKEFRVREYKAYSEANEWDDILQANPYSRLNNPTGIYGNAHDLIYVFVEGEIKEGASLGLEEILSTNTSGILNTLNVGLNIIPISSDFSTLFVRYDVNTHNSGKVLADYPNLKIHIENGVVNGFFEKAVHTDEDWRDITRNLATHPVIQVKGDRVLYHMEKKWLCASDCCKETITDAIGWWDDFVRWDHELMAWDRGIYGVKFNNLHCAITLDDDRTYMASTGYRTQYNVKVINKILNYERMQSNHDHVWGPGHEVGHTNQASTEVMGTSEISANFFANFTMYKMGKYMSRGDSLGVLINDFAESKCWTSMLGESKMRMWWQLYLYFHMAGVDTEFYPKLFTLLRENGIDPSPTHVQGDKDILHFAEKCCEAANMDLTEFFTVWGFFHPVNQLVGKEYTKQTLTVTQAMLNKTLAKMASYARKAPAIEFIEDRIEPMPRTDGGSGKRLKSVYDVGECGDVGQFTYFAPGNTPEAVGYYYTKVGKTIIIEKGTGAVGFKVYNGKGEYKAMSNKLKFTISEALATDPGMKIVAAEGDGDEVELKPYILNGEAAQLAALKYALSVTDYYVKNIDNNGLRVGYYYAHKLAGLKALKEAAQAAVDNSDQSAHTYGEYVTLIDNELNKVYTSNSLIKIQPKNYYSLAMYGNTTNMLDATSSSFCVSKGGNSQSNKKWAFETDDDSLYRLKTKGGLYIATMPKGEKATTTTNAALAAKFRVVSLENGFFYIELDNTHGGCLSAKSDNSICGEVFTSSNSWWMIRATEKNQPKYDALLLDSMIVCADEVVAELFDTTKLAAGDYTLNSDVVVKADNTLELAKALVAETASAKDVRANGGDEDYGVKAAALEEAINAVKATYYLIPKYPGDIADGITWYYMQNVSNDEYLSVERVTKRYLNYIMHIEVAEQDAKDDNMLWTFIPTGNANEYYIYNAGTGCALMGESNIEAMGGSAALPYTLQLDTLQAGFTIATGGKFIYGTGTYPKMNSTKANCYRLVKAFTNDNALLAVTSGDNYGRKVYGKEYAADNTMFVANESGATYVDLKATANAAQWVEKCKEQLSEYSNVVFYTDLTGNDASGKNVVSKDGNCQLFEMTPYAPYYIPEAFTAAKAVYTDANSASEAIRPLVLPFVPATKLTTAAPASYGAVDGVNTLTLAYTEFAANTPMFVVAGGEPVTASASNVQIAVSSKEDMATEYLLISYVTSGYKIGTYVKGSGDKYTKSTQAGTLAPFAMNIKELPGTSAAASNIVLYYDVASGIEGIDADGDGEKVIYDLTGRRIEEITTPGIYIINKKKVIVKEVK